jgi:hypothetical protein
MAYVIFVNVFTIGITHDVLQKSVIAQVDCYVKIAGDKNYAFRRSLFVIRDIRRTKMKCFIILK